MSEVRQEKCQILRLHGCIGRTRSVKNRQIQKEKTKIRLKSLAGSEGEKRYSRKNAFRPKKGQLVSSLSEKMNFQYFLKGKSLVGTFQNSWQDSCVNSTAVLRLGC